METPPTGNESTVEWCLSFEVNLQHGLALEQFANTRSTGGLLDDWKVLTQLGNARPPCSEVTTCKNWKYMSMKSMLVNLQQRFIWIL